MIKVKLEDLVADFKKLQQLCNVQLPVKTSYWVNKTFKKVQSEVREYEENRDKIIKELGEHDLEKDSWEVKDKDQLVVYRAKVKELLEVEVELPMESISIQTLGEGSIAPALMLTWLFTE